MMAGAGASPYELASDAASRLGIAVGAEELATLASDLDLGDGEMAAVAATFSYLAEKRRLASIETLLRLSRLPRREPKTFEGFDFSRIQGRDAAALGKLPSLADLYAHRNVAFVGPGGIGKTHLAQAYGVSVNIIFTISTNAFSPIAPTRIHRIRQRGCAAFGA